LNHLIVKLELNFGILLQSNAPNHKEIRVHPFSQQGVTLRFLVCLMRYLYWSWYNVNNTELMMSRDSAWIDDSCQKQLWWRRT